VSEGEHDDPGLVDRIPFEDVEWVHGRDANVVSLVGEREGLDLVCELLGGSVVSRCGYWKELRVIVGGLKGLR
jgi:hypothetical protein